MKITIKAYFRIIEKYFQSAHSQDWQLNSKGHKLPNQPLHSNRKSFFPRHWTLPKETSAKKFIKIARNKSKMMSLLCFAFIVATINRCEVLSDAVLRNSACLRRQQLCFDVYKYLPGLCRNSLKHAHKFPIQAIFHSSDLLRQREIKT